jgi:hypothetical protein
MNLSVRKIQNLTLPFLLLSFVWREPLKLPQEKKESRLFFLNFRGLEQRIVDLEELGFRRLEEGFYFLL